MHELFVPQGSNPLGNLKLGNPRCTKVEFDRTVRSNVLVIEGDLTQSRVQIPKEDRPVSSLQLNHSLVVLQILIPSSGQFLLELNVSNSPMTRMRLSAATFISRADVVDAKGMAHAKIPLVIPRNCWVQIVFHVGGIFTHLFRLPNVKWIDSVVLAGSCKIRKIMTCADEAAAIESKPGGMLLFAVPAYGPPVWQTAGGGASVPAEQQQQSSPTTDKDDQSPAAQAEGARRSPVPRSTPPAATTPPSEEVSSRGTFRTPIAGATSGTKSSELVAQAFTIVKPSNSGEPSSKAPRTSASAQDPGEAQSARFPFPSGGSPSCHGKSDKHPLSPTSGDVQSPSSAGPVAAASSPLRMRFLRSEDGTVSFTAKNPELEQREAAERQRQLEIIERLQREAEAVRAREDAERHQRLLQQELDSAAQYVRIVEADPAVNPLTGRRGLPTAAAPQTLASPSSVASASALAYASGSSAAGPVNPSGPSSSSNPSRRQTLLGRPAQGQAAAASDLDGGGDVGSWNDDDAASMYCSLIAGGITTSVVQMYNSGGKPVVVSAPPKKVDDASAAVGGSSASGAAGSSAAQQQGGLAGMRGSVVAQGTVKKPLVPRRQAAAPGTGKVRRPMQPPSMMLLSHRSAPAESHPADDYDPATCRRSEPEVGYGVGFMDIIHGDEEEEEYEE